MAGGDVDDETLRMVMALQEVKTIYLEEFELEAAESRYGNVRIMP